ncbi:MAG: hypothetical protein ABI227_04125 [Rhodanobacter sp.]
MSRSSTPDPKSYLGLYPPVFRFDVFDAVWVERNARLAQIAMAAEQAKSKLRENSFFDGPYDPRAIAWAFEHAVSLLILTHSNGLPPEPKRFLIRQTITNAMEDELGRHELADILQRTYAFSGQHAQLIANTEISLAQEHGGLMGALSLGGIKVKKWLLSNDDGVCTSCAGNAAQGWVPIGLPFASGAMAPLEHGGCRCGAVYSRAPR